MVMMLVLSFVADIRNSLISGSFDVLKSFLCQTFDNALNFVDIKIASITAAFFFAQKSKQDSLYLFIERAEDNGAEEHISE